MSPSVQLLLNNGSFHSDAKTFAQQPGVKNERKTDTALQQKHPGQTEIFIEIQKLVKSYFLLLNPISDALGKLETDFNADEKVNAVMSSASRQQ